MSNYRLIEKQVVFKGKKVRVEVDRLENEETQREVRREIVVHPGAVVILPVMEDGRVLLIRNHRYSVHQVLIELPAGTLEKGEDPMNCAGRELLEETGYLAGKLQRIGAFSPLREFSPRSCMPTPPIIWKRRKRPWRKAKRLRLCPCYLTMC